MRNRFFALILMVAAVFAYGCSRQADDGVGTVIGVSLKSMQDRYSLAFKQEAEEAAGTYGDVKIITMDAGGSAKKQASDIFFLSEQKVDALIVVSDDQEYTGRQMRSARAKDIYVAYVGQDEQDQNVDIHIYTDYRKIGRWWRS
jgi:simple sugar transport system substrate-binding protein